MINPRETPTNAADSAPGVDDGPAGVAAPTVNSRPRGRGAVFVGVLIVCLIVFGLMLFPRQGERDVSRTLGAGPTRAEMGAGGAPGAASPTAANPSAGQPGG